MPVQYLECGTSMDMMHEYITGDSIKSLVVVVNTQLNDLSVSFTYYRSRLRLLHVQLCYLVIYKFIQFVILV